MAELVLTNVNATVFDELQERAADHGRTAEEEAKAILSDALQPRANGNWAQVDAIYQRLAVSGRIFSDSADLIREDRDR